LGSGSGSGTVIRSYDESLLQAFKRETEAVRRQLPARGSKALADLLDANYTYVNERLAGIMEFRGFTAVASVESRSRTTLTRRVAAQGALAGGLTSYPDRTSPVLRGKWLLNNIFGLPVPPPPPGVDTNLESKPGGKSKSMRERLAQHGRILRVTVVIR